MAPPASAGAPQAPRGRGDAARGAGLDREVRGQPRGITGRAAGSLSAAWGGRARLPPAAAAQPLAEESEPRRRVIGRALTKPVCDSSARRRAIASSGVQPWAGWRTDWGVLSLTVTSFKSLETDAFCPVVKRGPPSRLVQS